MLLIIDNYDSFTYNLFQYLGELGAELHVVRNDQATLEELTRRSPQAVIVSPGPGRPEDAGISNEVIKSFGQQIPVLGVCLGHQCIGHVFGGRVIRAPEVKHGKTSQIFHSGTGIFKGLPATLSATRYHSLIIERKSLPECLEITAWTEDELIMGVQHRTLPIFGVQFHPESIMTAEGKKILQNFLNLIKES